MTAKGKRTIATSTIVAIIGILEAVDYTNFITGENAGKIIAGIAILFAILRVLTNTPVGKKTVNPDKPTPGGKG